MSEGDEIDRCACTCAGCSLMLALLIEAREEILGEDWS
jgi:hypothetical protein